MWPWSEWRVLAWEVNKTGVEGLSLERRALSIPSLLQGLYLLLLLRCRQAHLLSLLLVHYLLDCASCLVIEVLQWFGIVYLCCIDFRVAFEHSSPDLFLSLLEIQGNECFVGWFLYLPNWFWGVDLFVKITIDDCLSRFFADWYVIVFDLHVDLNEKWCTILEVKLAYT